MMSLVYRISPFGCCWETYGLAGEIDLERERERETCTSDVCLVLLLRDLWIGQGD